MTIYNQEEIRKKIAEALNVPYERMYPYEIEKELGILFKEAEQNNDEQIKREILWEIDLLNRTFGHKGTYQGEEVEEISNKWGFYLDTERDFTKPFSNAPFCEWKKEAVDYYKKRFEEATSELSKARYSFAIMTFSSGQERRTYAEKSFESWLKTAEKYISEKKYSEFYETPPFAYDFSIKLALSFDLQEQAKKAIQSLHSSILRIINEGDKRWNLELFEVESKINLLKYIPPDVMNSITQESITKIKEIIEALEKSKAYHFMRSYILCLIKYVPASEKYNLRKEFAETFVKEAEERKEPLIQSSFYHSAIKEYKAMQSEFSGKKHHIDSRLKELILKLNSTNKNIEYKSVETSITIIKNQIEDYITSLKKNNKDLFIALLEDNSLFPKIDLIKKQTEDQKKQFALQFIIPTTIYSKEEPITSHVSEEAILDFNYRQNILIGIRISELILKMTLDEIQKQINIKEKIENLINIEELKDIQPTLQRGFQLIFNEPKDYLSSVHLLTPYLEEVIRRIIKKKGKVNSVIEWERQKTTKEKTITFRKIEFGSLLANKEVREIIGNDFIESIKVYFSDEDQGNFRNLLSHGLLESKDIKETNSLFIAYVLLKLINLLKGN